MIEVVSEVHGQAGLVTLNRPKALNALSLDMVRELTRVLHAWAHEPAVQVIAIRGQGREEPFGAFCAGGDIRFFHQAALAGDPRLDDFFTEEYRLNHLLHACRKPVVAFMDGVVMGGGMGVAQGCRLRIATERTKMAMPETNIGLFPDVGGGFFLSRCPGHVGEYLALTGQVIGGADAAAAGLADLVLPSRELEGCWAGLAADAAGTLRRLQQQASAQSRGGELLGRHRREIDHFFGLDSVAAIVHALEADASEWARETAVTLRRRSPLMLHVTLEQLRRARQLDLAADLRMERDLVRHCFHRRPGAAGETVEGIRALAVDKDHAPRWNPARIEDVAPEQVAAFFRSPWPPHAHPLRDLAPGSGA
ncbi:enoyl-CoA hydratase/isomerase family protein [Ramlibacter sp.]|uniref:enoyl-CoA hydratase/isomerase family protein n=1 Tax=Ramlibacter sp. TaxID=1917967 RepID=UPI002B530399|nr:enoyl-CoA hydratase/isomerase family protein [Ramlibacter sp.]HWI83180.1 enoyl-CoA hydratase/isomerase family protein [Ramlibacter sp.]